MKKYALMDITRMQLLREKDIVGNDGFDYATWEFGEKLKKFVNEDWDYLHVKITAEKDDP